MRLNKIDQDPTFLENGNSTSETINQITEPFNECIIIKDFNKI